MTDRNDCDGYCHDCEVVEVCELKEPEEPVEENGLFFRTTYYGGVREHHMIHSVFVGIVVSASVLSILAFGLLIFLMGLAR